MTWSIKIGRVRGIDIFIHWTFLLFLGFIFTLYLVKGQGVWMAVQGAGFLVSLFGCVLLHELGHSVMAQQFGIQTKDIILLPIGGVARLKRMPEKPWQELLVALAGPAVNVVIAIVLGCVVVFRSGLEVFHGIDIVGGNFLVSLATANVVLVLFNMIPAFPMDGGRVLRALLASAMDYAAATRIAAGIGKALAVVFGFAGLVLWSNPLLVFIALFVFLGAQAEAESVSTNLRLRGLRVADAMLTHFRTLVEADTLENAARELLAGSQQDFPVMRSDRVVGILTRPQLVRGLAEAGREAAVADFMIRGCLSLKEEDPIETALGLMRETGAANIPVLRDGSLIGLLTAENLQELVMLRGALVSREGHRG
ncbi:MAG TPA: site-2 protease family protein [Verrucomicrobiae bacterium]|nr:site-2 protease family protein [Verrucomicrobiae bacterium]